jgi:hypothetical protein
MAAVLHSMLNMHVLHDVVTAGLAAGGLLYAPSPTWAVRGTMIAVVDAQTLNLAITSALRASSAVDLWASVLAVTSTS